MDGTFEQFAQVHGSRLVRRARRFLASHHLGEEAAAQVLSKVYERWPAISVLENPTAYVETMLTRHCLDLVGKASARREVSHAADALPQNQVGDVADQVAQHAEIQWALRQLSPHQRTALVLKVYEDWDNQQIAREMGVGQDTVRSHLMHGRRRLKELLGRARVEAEGQ
jgi:RNA polymerase sigma factor (sigma-70 family)